MEDPRNPETAGKAQVYGASKSDMARCVGARIRKNERSRWVYIRRYAKRFEILCAVIVLHGMALLLSLMRVVHV
jgi:hypothetical protein